VHWKNDVDGSDCTAQSKSVPGIRYILGAVELRVAEADETVTSPDYELARLELADSSDAHVEALLDRRQRTSQLLHRNVDDDDVAARRTYVQVLVGVVDLTTHTRHRDRHSRRRRRRTHSTLRKLVFSPITHTQ